MALKIEQKTTRIQKIIFYELLYKKVSLRILLITSNIIRPQSGRETFHWQLIIKKTSLRCDSNLKLHN